MPKLPFEHLPLYVSAVRLVDPSSLGCTAARAPGGFASAGLHTETEFSSQDTLDGGESEADPWEGFRLVLRVIGESIIGVVAVQQLEPPENSFEHCSK